MADEVALDSRLVYIDNEPVALTHSQMLLEQHGDPARHAVFNADLRDPDRLWHRMIETEVIDLGEPIALLLIAVLHFRQPGPDGVDVGPQAVARYRELMPRGSYLAISHGTNDGRREQYEAPSVAEFQRMYQKSSSSGTVLRSRQEIGALFGDFEMVEPGMTWTPSWHPEESSRTAPVITFNSPSEAGVWAGVGRKP